MTRRPYSDSKPLSDDDLGADPGKPEHAAPLWEYWAMVIPLVVLAAFVIASQVSR